LPCLVGWNKKNEAFCPEAAAEQVAHRLEITMRGLDISPIRPNAVLLAVGERSEAPELTAQVLAEVVYGGRERVIEVKLAVICVQQHADYPEPN
jgi:hypothetical protein